MAMESPGRRVPATSSKDTDSSDYPLDLRPGYYVTGEVGFVYGRSTGKFGGDYKEGYIMGEVGNDKLQITVGASYEDWNDNHRPLGALTVAPCRTRTCNPLIKSQLLCQLS